MLGSSLDSESESESESALEDECSDPEPLFFGGAGGLKTGVVVNRPEAGDRVTSSSFGESGVLVLERELLPTSVPERELASGVSAGREFANTAALERVLLLGPEPPEDFLSGGLELLSRLEFFFDIAFPSKVKILILLRSAGKQDRMTKILLAE